VFGDYVERYGNGCCLGIILCGQPITIIVERARRKGFLNEKEELELTRIFIFLKG
jgi:hypothetical protein